MFLHLHRKTKGHQRQVFKEEEDAIKVDLHEGCGRTKLFWLLALADSLTLKAMVEFRDGSGRQSKVSNLTKTVLNIPKWLVPKFIIVDITVVELRTRKSVYPAYMDVQEQQVVLDKMLTICV